MSEQGPEFLCAPGLRLEVHEKLTAVQFEMLQAHVTRIEEMVAQIERRLWLLIVGVLGVVLAETLRSVMHLVN